MSNHPHRSVSFEIVGRARPWFIKVDCGALEWPPLVFPFQMIDVGTEYGERCVRAAGRASLKAAARYYRHDSTGSFSPTLTLLGPDKNIVRQITIIRQDS